MNIFYYKKIHPGGTLGLSLMKVKDIMHTKSKLPLVNENIKMKNADVIKLFNRVRKGTQVLIYWTQLFNLLKWDLL